MQPADIAERLRAHIVELYNVPASDVDFTNDVHLFDYGYLDSFGAVALVAFVESEFHVVVSQADRIAYAMNTINEIAEFVSLRLSGDL
jgi:methoxymalonate biosynthesis acyl carrier protein